jgi:hypothetical protein
MNTIVAGSTWSTAEHTIDADTDIPQNGATTFVEVDLDDAEQLVIVNLSKDTLVVALDGGIAGPGHGIQISPLGNRGPLVLSDGCGLPMPRGSGLSFWSPRAGTPFSIAMLAPAEQGESP